MAFLGAQKRLIDNGISLRDYRIKFGAPCYEALLCFRERDAIAGNELTTIPEEQMPPLDIPNEPLNTQTKTYEFSDDMIRLMALAVSNGFTKILLADIFSQLSGKEISRYHIARALTKKKKTAGSHFSKNK